MTSTPPSSDATARGKWLPLEGLRGIMALWVVIGHISLTFGWRLPLVDHNTLAVDVFVLLSGCVIGRLLLRRVEPYGAYIRRRAWRIVPLYLVALALSSALLPVQEAAWQALAGTTPANTQRLLMAREGMAHLSAHLAWHLTLLHGLVPATILPMAPYTLMGQAWSISLEWQFYLLAPWLMAGLRHPRGRWGVLLAALALAAAAPGLTNAYLGRRIAYFLLGMLTAIRLESPSPHRPDRWALAAIAACVMAIGVQGGAISAVPLLIWLMATRACRAPTSRLHQALAQAPLVALGERSYSLYLLHMVPLYTSLAGFTALGIGGTVREAGVTLVTLAAALPLAWLAHRTIERPAMALGRRPRPPAPSPLAATQRT